TADLERAGQLKQRRNLTGALPGSLESYLALRGLRTLSVRMERASANAAVLASRLAEHPAVRTVNWLGRADHPQADRVAKLLDNHGAVLSFTVELVAAARPLLRAGDVVLSCT